MRADPPPPSHSAGPGRTGDLTGDQRRRLLAAARIYLVVTPDAVTGWEDAARPALDTGLVGLLQLRWKGPGGELARLAARAHALARAAGIPWILNDRPDLAALLGADGAHVGDDDVPPAEARRILGPDLLLGVSTHDEDEVRRAAAGGLADYAGLGPCYPTGTKALARRPGGPDLVRRCAPLAGTLPLFPIAGIDAANAADLVRAGARRLAVGGGILGARDPAAAVRALDRALREGSLPR